MIDTVLFDLDGTIIDTNELIISSFMHVLEKHVPTPLTREVIIPKMGMTLEQQLQFFSGSEDVTHFHQAYRTYNDAHHDEMVQPFPHVLEVIKELDRRGITMGVVTTKNKPGTFRVLEMFGLDKYMKAIVTVMDVEHPKPHPEPVLMAISQLGADPAATLMVGDSPVDIQSAKAAGARSAGVAWSLKGEKVLREYNPDYILHDMTDLYSLVEQE
ncbi:pyrophosphatase PpaX [Paenibacillus rhizosphaerae]|uniref:Pyrophosphatase PpaX n=1 Tax=Paenibacillus rhizosphaerae TaxID=297318 RepID=A0A1R1EKL9_9BACL|nr:MULTISPECIES: pyrophosphatase PpaX [Paenibacillus]OMF52373.1 pyrophosphatase PpaX [Paenibacillus rhizosphaerae]RED35152.1 pyrophosphatase PpaX [Paenibacillus sp. VMFN-D1]UYO05703.1 pyrophosphatase PpaX [Paenibacillus sp. PSB04]